MYSYVQSNIRLPKLAFKQHNHKPHTLNKTTKYVQITHIALHTL